jgi:hypothetical protein
MIDQVDVATFEQCETYPFLFWHASPSFSPHLVATVPSRNYVHTTQDGTNPRIVTMLAIFCKVEVVI